MSSFARIEVVIEVSSSGTYGDDWTLDKVREQVKKEAITSLHHKLGAENLKIIGKPKVRVVSVGEDL